MAAQTYPYKEFQSACAMAAKELADQAPESMHWLNEARKQGLVAFENTLLPTRKTESWRYTSIFPLTQENYLNTKAAGDFDAGATAINLDSASVFIVNGQVQTILPLQNDDVEVVSFADADETQKNLLHKHLSPSFEAAEHPFAALNTAALQDGILIKVGRNQKIEKPIQIVYVSDADSAFSSHSRVIVIQESGSQLQLVETFSGKAERHSFCNTLTQIFLEENASLTHHTMNTEADTHIHTGGVHIQQQKGSNYIQHAFALGGKLKRRDVQVKLLGELANCELFGTYLVREVQHVDFRIVVDHVAPHCTSEERYKGIVGDKGRAIFNGRVHIHRDAQQSSADMSNNNLLLSKTAEVNTKPELEIYADDVKCSHGTTIGQLDEQALFYFQSRGISHQEAHRMLSHAFIDALLEEIPLAGARDFAQQKAETFHNAAAEADS